MDEQAATPAVPASIEMHPDDAGFRKALDLFGKEGSQTPPVPPKPVVEGEVAEPPVPEPEPKPESPEPGEPPQVPQEARKPDDFVEFTTPEQKERFNKVFGYAKRLEREKADLLQRLQQPPVYQPQQPPPQPQRPETPAFTEPKPKLGDFADADQWGDALSDWAARRAEHIAVSRAQEAITRHQVRQEHEAAERSEQMFKDSKITEGRQKYGLAEFDGLSAEVAHFVTPIMSQTLFQLQRFPDVVVELGRNLQEAERISRLSPIDQIYELKSLERRLTSQEQLKAKAQPKQPTRVEQPGAGVGPTEAPTYQKLKKAALTSGGDLDAYAKLFMLESQPPR